MYSDQVDLSEKMDESRDFLDKLSISPDECDMLEKATRGQNCNQFWKEARSYLITASNFDSVIKRKPDTAPDLLVKKLRMYDKPLDTKALRYGRKFEKRAVKAYVQHHKARCKSQVDVEYKGLQINPKYPYLGASVDGVISCQKCKIGAVEVKCPFTGRHLNPTDCCKDSNFCCKFMDGEVLLKPNHRYFYQVMGQMAIAELPWADFVIWTKKGMSVQRIIFQSEVWEFMLAKLHAFYLHSILPELFTYRVQRKKALFPFK